SVTEGDAGTTTTMTFTVTLSQPATSPVTVNYATANSSATAGSDYVATSGPLTFAPGETTQTVTVQVLGDGVWEGDEWFYLNLTAPANATIADGQGIGTIIDDDPAPTVSISDATVTEGNSGTASATFTVTLSGPIGLTFQYRVTTSNGTALAGADY